ncbi:MAG TPA: TonB-dependent receptor, partial [Candidatus Marinimicrobia bacterium]|nr:TonB-dependent receptor [Candidatus Neomarinimicrobiota bacterium]
NEISGFPEKMLNMWLEIQLPGRTSMRSEVKYVGEYYTSNIEDPTEKIESYSFINLQLRKSIPIFQQTPSLAFYVNNLLNDQILLHGIGSDFFPMASRNYLISFELKGDFLY